MTKEEQLAYLNKNYESSDLWYIKKLIGSEKTLPIGELAERFIELDESYKGESWNLLQILTNIDIIVPLEDRTPDSSNEQSNKIKTFKEWFEEFGIDYLDIWGESDDNPSDSQWSFTTGAVEKMIDVYENEVKSKEKETNEVKT